VAHELRQRGEVAAGGDVRYLERLVDWESLIELRRGGAVDVAAEVAAYATLLETAAKLAASFERTARENWHLEAELTPDGGAQSRVRMLV